jgi:hypothetical protein
MSVPCERVFSSSSETMTKKRNRTKPGELMEALQMLKFMLKKRRLNLTDTWETLTMDDQEDTGVLGDILGAQGTELDKVLETLGEDE